MCGDNDLPKSHRLANRIPSVRHGKTPFKSLVRKVKETPQILQAFILVCLSELEGETLLLKTPCMFDTRLGGIELELTWKSLP